MNYSKVYKTKKSAIDKIKELEKDATDYVYIIGKMREEYEEGIKSIEANHKVIYEGIKNGSEVARLKEHVVQLRKTQNYQSNKIVELLDEVKDLEDGQDIREETIDRLNKNIERLSATIDEKDKIINITFDDLWDAKCRIEKLESTIIRQANDITDLEKGE